MPQGLLDTGVEIIRWLAAHRSPPLDLFFLFVTDSGSTIGYLVLLPLLWWGVSWRLAARLFVAIVVSVYLNALLKDFFAVERPFLYAELTPLRLPDGYSFPSGHAQHAAVSWGLLALHVRKRPFSVIAVAMVFLVGVSRVYLGVHFPTDVLAGWLVGATIAVSYQRLSPPAIRRTSSLALPAQLGLSFGLPMLATLGHSSRDVVVALGSLAGALTGLVLAHRSGLYPEETSARSRRARLIVGLVGLPVVYLTMRHLAPSECELPGRAYLWLRYAAIGLWVSFLVPRIVLQLERTRASD